MSDQANVKRGTFMVFEGIDRCGKSTQSKLLTDALNEQGKKTIHMRFPGLQS
jgi:dTMP kinase